MSYYYQQFKIVNGVEWGRHSVKKIGEALNTAIDLLVKSKASLDKKLNESIKLSGHFKKILYKQGKLQLYTSFKERPGFENYLNLPNKKLHQAITKLRISAHKFLIEIGHLDYRKRTEKICPLCCDGIGEWDTLFNLMLKFNNL